MVGAKIRLQRQNRNHKDERITKTLIFILIITDRNSKFTIQRVEQKISCFIWGGKRPRIKFTTLQIPQNKGGLALPNLLELCSTNLALGVLVWSYVYCKVERYWVKNRGVSCAKYDSSMFKKCKEMLDPITKLTLEIWFTVIRKYNLEKEIKFLTFNYDSKFKPGATDSNFKQWIN